MIDEHEWKYVLQAASDGTFSAAAKKLFVSQPSLSQSIKKIEGEIGMPLFDRSQTPLQLTAAGEIYVRKAKEMQRIYHELVQETADLTGMNRVHSLSQFPHPFHLLSDTAHHRVSSPLPGDSADGEGEQCP